MTCGVLMYAHNNAEIDYFKIACANALMVQKNLNVPVTLVTDAGTVEWGKKALGDAFVDKCFEHIIVVDRDWNFKNSRNYSDTSYTTKSLQFYNCNHWEAFELSPYDETLFIDADYLIMSSALNNCWGSDNDIMINHNIFSPGSIADPHTKYIDDFGIRQYWATVIYFKKTELAKFLFELVKHIQEKYYYYTQLYYFSNGMYRNDYAFSIAIHMLNGFSSADSTVKELPIPGLLMSWDTDDIYKVSGVNDILLYTEKETKGTYMLTRLKEQDVHIMNKWAINRHAEKLIELYGVSE
jgi:hypothetical protein